MPNKTGSSWMRLIWKFLKKNSCDLSLCPRMCVVIEFGGQTICFSPNEWTILQTTNVWSIQRVIRLSVVWKLIEWNLSLNMIIMQHQLELALIRHWHNHIEQNLMNNELKRKRRRNTNTKNKKKEKCLIHTEKTKDNDVADYKPVILPTLDVNIVAKWIENLLSSSPIYFINDSFKKLCLFPFSLLSLIRKEKEEMRKKWKK